MPNEADTCRKFVLPKLYDAGWTDDQINRIYCKISTQSLLES